MQSSKEYVAMAAEETRLWRIQDAIEPDGAIMRKENRERLLSEREGLFTELVKAADHKNERMRRLVRIGLNKVKYDRLPDGVYERLLGIKDAKVRGEYKEIFDIQGVKRDNEAEVAQERRRTIRKIVAAIPSGKELDRSKDPAAVLMTHSDILTKLASAASEGDHMIRADVKRGFEKVDGHRLPDEVFDRITALPPERRAEFRRVIAKQELLRGARRLSVDGLEPREGQERVQRRIKAIN